jgi:glutamate synthase (NADPH/NADH) small chain
MDFLPLQNRAVAEKDGIPALSAAGKHVVVIGGGDTGSDCVGTCIRQGAASVGNFELMSMPAPERPSTQPWPYWPMRLRKSTSHAEGCERFFSVMTKRFEGADGQLTHLVTANLEFVPDGKGGTAMQERPGTEHEWRADMVLLALGFVGPERDNVVQALGVEIDPRGNIKCDAKYRTSRAGVFAAGDARRGQSLIVWAIAEGRECARSVDEFLMGSSPLPTKGVEDLPRV